MSLLQFFSINENRYLHCLPILIQLIDSLIDEKCRSGIAVAEDCRLNVADTLKYAVNERCVERLVYK